MHATIEFGILPSFGTICVAFQGNNLISISVRAACSLALCVFAFSSPAADYKSEYDKNIKSAQIVGALGPDFAGDQVNFYTGSTSFHATDVEVPGIGALPFSLGRTLAVDAQSQRAVSKGDIYTPEIVSTVTRAFGEWDWDIPYISTTMTQAGGWAIDSGTPFNRCSIAGQTKADGSGPATGAPPAKAKELGMSFGTLFAPEQYWHGYELHLAGSGQTMLTPTVLNTQRPSTGGPYHWTTNQNWWFSCLNLTTAQGGGEGFLAVAPDGTKYTFNQLAKRNVDSVSQTISTDDMGGPNHTFWLFRAEYLMLPTSIDDRFGNWVHYTWDTTGAFPKLTSITASDGRTITLTYSGALVSSVTDGTRTWTYGYSSGSLSST